MARFHLPAILAALAALLSGASARAQVDSPAAEEARAALRAVERQYALRVEYAEWARLLDVPDLRYELRAGAAAKREVLSAAVVQLVSGRVAQFSEPAFERLAKALDVRAQELDTIPAADWPSACRAAAESFEPIDPELLERARAILADRVEKFEQALPSIRDAKSAWAVFLHWPETRALALPAKPAPAVELAALDRLETRWAAAPSVWEDDLLFETSVAARVYIRLLRGYLLGETREMHAVAWNQLGDLLTTYSAAGGSTARIAAAVRGRESIGQASRLTASIRAALSHPNIVMQVSTKWLESQFNQKVDEPFDVNDVFAGTRSVGRGRLVGTMHGEILPSSAVGQWVLRFRGTSTARTSGSAERVYVVSRATTQVAGTKPFLLDALGLAPQRALAGAITSVNYEQIDAPGLARRRSAAISETYARRPQAESEGAAMARRSLLEQLNTEAAKVAVDFNRSYHEQFRDPRINSGRPGPEVRVRSGDGLFEWTCRLEGPAAFAAPAPPPRFDAGTEVVLCLEASALEEQGQASLGGKHMTAEELSKAMKPSEEAASEEVVEEFSVTFADDPVDVRFSEGVIHARLYVTKFDSADVKYPAMHVDVAYQPVERDGTVVFVRQGRVRVTPIAQTGEDNQPVISGRQQTLRVAVQRKLGKVLTEELLWSDFKLPLGDEKDPTKLELKRAQLVAPWLQIGLAPQSKS